MKQHNSIIEQMNYHLAEAARLSDREWVCPVCGTKHDRDDNSSKNIENTEGHSVCGCGGGVRLNSVKQSSMKRQPPDTEDACPK